MNEKGYDPYNNNPHQKGVQLPEAAHDTVEFSPSVDDAKKIQEILETLPRKDVSAVTLTESDSKKEEGSEWRLTA
jgi:hypothetical protein